MTDRPSSIGAALSRISWPTALVVIATLGAILGVYELSKGEDRTETIMAIGMIGTAITAVLSPLLRKAAPAILATLFAAQAAGCGASMLSTHATIGTVAVASVEGSVPLIETGCDVSLTACHGSAECIDRVAQQCLDARAAWSAARSSVLAYLAAIEVMSHAEEGAALPALGSLLRSLSHTYEAARVALAVLHVELPPLPPAAVPILAALMGGST